MLHLNFNPFPELSTERLVMRQLKMEDANEIFFLRSDETVMRYIDKPPATSIDEAHAFIERIDNVIKNREGIMWGISLKENPSIIGNIGIWNMQKEHFRCEIGYSLNPAYHQKGIMYEAITAALKYCFEVMGFHSVEANVNPENQASIKLLEKIGFVREAYFKENYYFNGRFLDSAIYSLLTPVKHDENR